MKIKKNHLRIFIFASIIIIGAIISFFINKVLYLPQGHVSKYEGIQRKEPGNITVEIVKKGLYRLCIEDSSGKVLGVVCDTLLSVGQHNLYLQTIEKFTIHDLKNRYFIVIYFNGKIEHKTHLSNDYRL